MSNFKLGDQVVIVNGHLKENHGLIRIIVKVEKVQGTWHYAFEDMAWFYDDDLVLIYRPDYR